MIENKKKDNGFFVVGMLLLAFSNVFAISGYAHSLYYNDIATWLTFIVFAAFIIMVYNKC